MQTEALFHTFSQVASAANIPPKPSDEELRTESQLQDLLEKVLILAPVTSLG